MFELWEGEVQKLIHNKFRGAVGNVPKKQQINIYIRHYAFSCAGDMMDIGSK